MQEKQQMMSGMFSQWMKSPEPAGIILDVLDPNAKVKLRDKILEDTKKIIENY